MGRLQHELRQRKPFQGPAHEAVVALMRTADLVRRRLAGVVEPLGLAVAVANAVPEVKAMAHLVTQAGGGSGAVREFCEFVMRAQGTLEGAAGRHGAQG